MGIRKACLIISLLSFIGSTAFSQNEAADSSKDTVPIYASPVEGEASFRLSETESSVLFLQRLKWEEAQYAVSYHVILERKRENLDAYAEVLRRNVSEPFMDVSVPAGEYRFRVMSFNILGLLDSQSEWEYFVVMQALKPSVLAFSPAAFYFDRLTPRILTLTGENLLPESEIFLVHKTMLDEAGEPWILTPTEIYRNELGESARLVFAEEDLLMGKYEIVVKNPGGLEARTGDFNIAVAKPYDINISAGYSPSITLFGQKDKFLDQVFVPLSFSVRGSFIPYKWDVGNLGFELNTGWFFLTSEWADKDLEASAHMVFLNAGALFEYWIIKRELSADFRAGIGVTGLFGFRYTYISTGMSSADTYNSMAFSYFLGASIKWMIHKQIFVEGGVDFFHFVHPDAPIGLVRFGVFGGYQF